MPSLPLKNYGPTGPQRSTQSMLSRGIKKMQAVKNMVATHASPAAWTNYPPTTGTIRTTTFTNNRIITLGCIRPLNTSTTTIGTGSTFNIVANTLYSVQDQDDYYNLPLVRETLKLMGECSVADGESATIKLPDGSVIEIDRDGSYRVNDADAKVIYRANRIRDFNAFLNASDKLEEFIRFCGLHGARQGEALDIPIKLFIQWLIVEAAKADKEPEPEDVKLIPDLRKQVFQPKCVSCGRFIPRMAKQRKIEFCSTPCFERQMLKIAA